MLSHIQKRLDRKQLEPKLLELTAMLMTKLDPLVERSRSAGSSALASLSACGAHMSPLAHCAQPLAAVLLWHHDHDGRNIML